MISANELFGNAPLSNGSLCQKSQEDIMLYQVNKSDTLCRIAVNYNTTTSYLMKLNKLSSTLIFPGQVLHVPLKNEEEDYEGSSAFSKNDDTPHSFPSSIEDAYSFLSPLAVPTVASSSSNQSASKPFKDLPVVAGLDQARNGKLEAKHELVGSTNEGVISSNPSSTQSSANHGQYEPLHTEDVTAVKEVKARDANGSPSIESLSSEPFEENFLKLNVHHLTDTLEHVRGILIVTPISLMFDPDPSCPMAKEHGCEKFGVMCDLKNIVSLGMYRDAEDEDAEEEDDDRESAESMTSDHDDAFIVVDGGNDCAPDPYVSDCTPHIQDLSVNPGNGVNGNNATEASELNNDDLLHSNGYHDEDHSLEVLTDQIDASIVLCPDEGDYLYFCIRSTEPMMKTFSVISALTDGADEVDTPRDNSKEAWFHVPRRNSDQLMAFFMQWSPDPYALDFAEQNGFFVDSLETKKKKSKKVEKRRSSRSRSTTSTCSSEYSDDYVGNKKVEKEWELVSIEESKRRTQLDANQLANDDSCLIPELRHTSHLLNDDTLLELCKRMPARCIGCPWRLLYSTFEHGMSLRTLYRRVNQRVPAEHPVFILVQDTDGHIFGGFSSSSPHISEHFYGTGESFLFKLEPELEFFEWTGENNFFVKGYSDSLVLGGGDGSVGLWIDEDLKQGRSRTCLTFNNSILSSKEDFCIQNLEVWGFE